MTFDRRRPMALVNIVVALVGAFLLAALAACTGTTGQVGPSTTGGTVPGDGTTGSETTDSTGRTSVGPDEPVDPEPLGPAWTKLSEPGVGGRITSLAFDPADPNRLFVGGDLLGIAVTDDFGDTWQETFGFASWEIGDINATPAADGRIWTGSLSGPHASADGGTTWSLERTGMPEISGSRYSQPIEAVLVDPSDGTRLLAFTGNQRDWEAPGAYSGDQWQGDGSVWESVDGGDSWQRLSVVAAGGNIRAATFVGGDPSALLVAVANRGVFRSTDGGASWTESSTGLPHFNAYDITAHPTDGSIAWVAMGEGPQSGGNHVPGGIWASTDGGATWAPSNDGMTIIGNDTPFDTGRFHQIVVAPTDPDRLYTSNLAPGQAAIYRSDDGGSNWSVVADGSTPRPNAYESALRAFDIAVHPNDPDRVAIGSDDTLLGSTDGGSTWSDLTTLEAGTGFFAGRGYTGLIGTDIVFDTRLPDHGILLGFDGGNFIQTIDGGRTWRRTVQDISPWGGGIEAAYSPNNADRVYVLLGQFSNFRGIGISDDGGATFRLAAGASHGLPPVGNVDDGASGLAVLEANGTDVVFAAIGRQLWRSVDDASTFAVVPGLSDVRDVAVSGDGTVYVATGAEVLFSVDGGSGFDEAGNSPIGVTELFTSESEPTHVYSVAFRDGDGGAARFDGESWTSIFDDFFTHAIAVDPQDPENLVATTSEPAFHDISNATGVYFSDDGGSSWTVVNDGLPLTRARIVEFDPLEPDRVVLGTTGRGFYQISFSQALGS